MSASTSLCDSIAPPKTLTNCSFMETDKNGHLIDPKYSELVYDPECSICEPALDARSPEMSHKRRRQGALSKDTNLE